MVHQPFAHSHRVSWRGTISDLIQVLTTAHSYEAAQELADLLVNSRLAACVQIMGPITSTYWWDGRVEKTQEWACLAKSLPERFSEIERAIQEHHSYDVPEIVALSALQVSASYLEWVRTTLSATTD